MQCSKVSLTLSFRTEQEALKELKSGNVRSIRRLFNAKGTVKLIAGFPNSILTQKTDIRTRLLEHKANVVFV